MILMLALALHSIKILIYDEENKKFPMEIALIENEYILPEIVYQHDWTHILYIIVSTVFFLIQVCQRISLDIFYSSSKYIQ